MLLKTIWHPKAKVVASVLLCIYRDIPELAERSQVVKSAHMVIMLVGDDDSVNWTELFHSQTLFTEVRSTVNKYPNSIRLDKPRTTKSLVSIVLASAYLATATDLRYPC